MEDYESMVLSKVTYSNADETIINDANLNEIQDEIINNTNALSNKADKTTATVSSDGLMSKTDKEKLNGIESNANHTNVDTSINNSSTNPVQNKAIKQELDKKQDKLVGSGTNQNIKTINGNNLLGEGNISVGGGGSYVLPPATSTTLGGVMVGNNLTITSTGVLTATDTTYENATTSTDGLMSKTDKVKVDDCLSKTYTSETVTFSDDQGHTSEIIFNKFNSFVIGSYHINGKSSGGTAVTVSTIPSGYRPKTNIMLSVRDILNTTGQGAVNLKSNGDIDLASSTVVNDYGTFIYVI